MIFSLTLTPDEIILQYDETFFRLSAPVFAGMAGGGVSLIVRSNAIVRTKWPIY